MEVINNLSRNNKPTSRKKSINSIKKSYANSAKFKKIKYDRVIK